MRRTIGLSLLAACTAVAFAAPAAADQDEFVRVMQDQFVFLSPQQIISAGNKICAATHGGMPSADAAIMVSDYLGISVPGAGDMVSLAAVELGC